MEDAHDGAARCGHGAHLSALARTGQLAAALAALPRDGEEVSWQRGWILAAMGRYGPALDALAAVDPHDPVLAAAACATRAWVLREIGLYAEAEDDDRRGLACLTAGERAAPHVGAGLRIGLVLDGLGGGGDPQELAARRQAAAEALQRDAPPALRLRLEWATGELALAGGRPQVAGTWFQRAQRRARDVGLRRHAARSTVLLARANAAAGASEAAGVLAAEGLAEASHCGAQPLRWPALLVLADVCSELRHRHAAGDVLADLLDTLPEELRRKALTRPPAADLVGAERSAERAGSSGTACGPATRAG